jgi:ParB-like chromosome segregation protein Spo0J
MKRTDAVTTADRLRLESWFVDRLIPSARNARMHSDAQIAEIAASIQTFGFSNPILVGEDGDIIAGHGRLAAARQLGLTEVPVIVLSGLTEVQRRQLMLADNRITLNAAWDLEMLHLELKDLALLGADLAVLGFTAQELAQALKPAGAGGLTDEDEVPELSSDCLWRQYRRCRGRRAARWPSTRTHGHRPALRGRLRSGLASSRRRESICSTRKNP